MMQLTTDKNGRAYLKVAGKRAAISISTGPWVAGVPASLIKLRPRKDSFPAEFRSALMVENNSDMREDYFEADSIRLMPGHPLYAAAIFAAA